MIDTTTIHVMTSCLAMISLTFAVAAHEFRPMSSAQKRRNPLPLQSEPEMRSTRIHKWRTH